MKIYRQKSRERDRDSAGGLGEGGGVGGDSVVVAVGVRRLDRKWSRAKPK